MQEAALYIGTFDPCHDAHLKQLEYTYAIRPFKKAVVAIVQDNPKKPHATPWQERVQLTKLAVSSKKLPFDVVVLPIAHATTVDQRALRAFTTTHLAGYNVFRTVGSDTIRDFASDTKLHSALTAFEYAVILRPMVTQDDLTKIVASLPPVIAKNFSYYIAHDWGDVLIAATDVREDVEGAYAKQLITPSQLAYIKQRKLYNLAIPSSD